MNDLSKKIAAAVADPGAIAGRRLGPAWGRGNDGYAREQEPMPDWMARAVIATLEDQGRLLPGDGRIASLLPAGESRSTAAVFYLEGPREVFRFMVNQLGHQVEFGAAARGVLVDLRDSMGYENFDTMSRMLLGVDRHEKLRDRFQRSWDCRSCETTIRVGAKHLPDREAGAVCARCCKGYPEYEAQLVKRPNPVPTTAQDGAK